MKRYLYITCILLGILTGCTQKQEQHDVFPESLDLLSALRAQAQQETVVIDFRKDAAPQKYLLYGWGRAEQHFTWAIEKRRKILFYHLLRGFSQQAPSEHSKKSVDVNTLDKKTLEHLKELGYIQ